MESFWQTQPPPSRGLSQPEIQMSYVGHKSQGQPIFYGLFHIRSDSQIPIAVIISHRRGWGDLIPSYSSYTVRIPGTVSKSCWWYWWWPEANIPTAGYHWLCCPCFHGRINQSMVNTLRPRQNGRHFPDDIFKCIFLNENWGNSIKISLKFVPKVPINNIPALIQIMAWRRSGNKPLSEPMMVNLVTHTCVTWPQWVKNMSLNMTKAPYCCMTETSIYHLQISTDILVPVQNINWK